MSCSPFRVPPPPPLPPPSSPPPPSPPPPSSEPPYPYTPGTILSLQPHLPPPPPLYYDRSYRLKHSQTNKLRRLLRTYGEDTGRLLFFGDAFHRPWPQASADNSSNGPNRPAPLSIHIESWLHTGHGLSQLLLVSPTTSGLPHDQLLVAKIYDPFLSSAQGLIAVHPVLFAQRLYATEVHAYNLLPRSLSSIPSFYGSYTTSITSTSGTRTVCLLLIEYIPGPTLADPTFLASLDAEGKRTVLKAALQAEMAVFDYGVMHKDLACRNFVLRSPSQLQLPPLKSPHNHCCNNHYGADDPGQGNGWQRESAVVIIDFGWCVSSHMLPRAPPLNSPEKQSAKKEAKEGEEQQQQQSGMAEAKVGLWAKGPEGALRRWSEFSEDFVDCGYLDIDGKGNIVSSPFFECLRSP